MPEPLGAPLPRPTHALRTGRLRRSGIVAKAVAALALTGGSGLVLTQPAAAGSTTLYVSATAGHDLGTCSSQRTPCATISYALSRAADGATIYVAKGTYTEQLTITQNVTIIGRSPGGVVIAPAGVVQNDVGTDSATPQFAIVDIHNASSDLGDVNLENLVINGTAAGASSFNSCSDNFPGVYYHDANGLLRNDTITGVEMPSDLFGCQTGKGVGALVASDVGHSSTVTVARVTVRNFQKNGLECIDPGTSCVIENSTVTGIGPTALTSQNGVEIWGVGSLAFMHNKVSGDTYTGPSGPAQATGLLILNAGSVDVRSNKLTANDVDVYAGTNPSFSPVVTAGVWMIRGNRLTGATDGTRLPRGTSLDRGTATGWSSTAPPIPSRWSTTGRGPTSSTGSPCTVSTAPASTTTVHIATTTAFTSADRGASSLPARGTPLRATGPSTTATTASWPISRPRTRGTPFSPTRCTTTRSSRRKTARRELGLPIQPTPGCTTTARTLSA